MLVLLSNGYIDFGALLKTDKARYAWGKNNTAGFGLLTIFKALFSASWGFAAGVMKIFFQDGRIDTGGRHDDPDPLLQYHSQ